VCLPAMAREFGMDDWIDNHLEGSSIKRYRRVYKR
jgi:hypothetical protein